MPPRFVCKQLSHPSGIFAPIMGLLMNRHNAKMNAFALEQLRLTSADRVLEIGFGGGLNLPHLIAAAGFVGAVDRSSAMVRRARSRFAQAISAGHADFREGNVEAIPFPASSFEKVCTVNTVYFWDFLEGGFAEIRRVLSPDGYAAIGFLPKDHMDRMGMAPDIFATRAPNEIVAALERTGFSKIRIERPTPSTAWNVVLASR